MSSGGDYVGLLSFFSFAFSVIAAVLAIDLYALLRTGRSGSTWRVLIIASVMFALMHALRLAEILNFGLFRSTHLSEIVELMFVMALAYAFYLQRKTFGPRDRAASTPLTSKDTTPSSLENLDDEDAEDSARSMEPEADPGPAHQSQESLLSRASSGAKFQDQDEDEDAAASEWARLNGQADRPVAKQSRRE